MLIHSEIKKLAYAAGFDLCGVTSCGHMAEEAERFDGWIAGGNHSTLSYLERNREKRFSPSMLVEGARTAVVCAVSYKNRFSGEYDDASGIKIASYACAVDYHTSVRKMLQHLFEMLRGRCPGLTGRAFVDSAPLAEKSLAVRAGLGWIGRQSLLVTPEFGTYLFLGELLLCEPCDRYDRPLEGAGCGECRRCVEACPTGAILAGRMVDTRRCIACRTIERETEGEFDAHGWIFGCEACQSPCPYNRRAQGHHNPAFDPLFDPAAVDWAAVGDEEFSMRFGATPLARAGLDRIRRQAEKNSGREKRILPPGNGD